MTTSPSIEVIDKHTHGKVVFDQSEITLTAPSVVKLPVSPEQVQKMEREGNNLIIKLHSGEVIVLQGFFNENPEGIKNDVVFEDDDGALWLAEIDDGGNFISYSRIDEVDPLLIHDDDNESLIALMLTGAAAAALLANRGGGGGHHAPKEMMKPTVEVDSSKPGEVIVRGKADPDTSITITFPDGSTATTTTDANGNYEVDVKPVPNGGGEVVVEATDKDGNTAEGKGDYTDTTPPPAPTVDVDSKTPGEVIVSGKTDPDTDITITFPDGTTVTTVTDDNGDYEVVVKPAPDGSGEVVVEATDKDGNTSDGKGDYTDTTPPTPPTVEVDSKTPDEVIVSGKTDPDTDITITFPDGTTVTTVTDDNGDYEIVVKPAPDGSGEVVVEATDKDGNTSDGKGDYTDITPPTPPTVDVDSKTPGEVIVSGKTDPDTEVVITFPDGSTVTTITDDNGDYEVVVKPAPDGSGEVVVEATDKDGNTSDGKGDYTDTTPPTPPTVEVDSETPDEVTVSGKTDPNTDITVTFPDGTTATTVTDDNGDYEVVVKPAPSGSGEVVVEATDKDGNTSEGKGDYTDTTPPDEVINVTVETTAPDEVTVAGQAEPESTVSITFPDGTSATAITDRNGNFTAVLTPAPNGSGDVEVLVTDKAGNGPVGPVTAPYTDVTPPDVPTIDELVDNTDGTVTVNGTAADPEAETVTVTFPDGTSQTVPVENGRYTATSEGPLESGQNITAAANDADNNTSAPASETYTDTENPEVPINVTVETTAPDEVTVSGEAEPESEVTIVFPDGTSAITTTDKNGNFEAVLTPAPNGSGDVEVTVVDKNGNGPVGPVTAPYTDVTPPDAPTIDELVDNPNGTVTVNGTAADPDAETVTVTFPDGTSQTVPVENGRYTATSEGPLKSGEDITAAANDGDNNTSDPVTETYTDTTLPDEATNVVVDTTAPDEVTVTGEAEPESEVTIVFPDGTTVTSITDEEGNFEAVVTPAPDGSGDVEVTVTDKNGNGPSDPVTAPYTDVTPPDAPTIDELVDNPDGTVTVNGTAADPEAETVTVTFPDGTSQTVPVENGSYTATSEGPLESGEEITAAANDADNNASDPVSETYTDTVLPEEPINVQVNTTAPDEVTVSGEAEPESTVSITFPDGTTATAITDKDGNFEAVLTPAPNGSGEVEVTVTDKNGNGPVGPVTAPYTDVTPPDAPTIDELVDNPDGTVTVNGTAADPEAETVTVTFPDGTSQTVPVENGSYTATSNGPLETDQQVTAKANDADGNSSDPVSRDYGDITPPDEATNVAVDTTAPDEVTVTGEAEPESTVSITFPDGTTATAITDKDGNFEAVLTPAPNGSGDVEVMVTDKNGNGPVGPVTAPYTDVTPPDAPTIDELVDNADGTVTVNGTAADPEAETVTVTFPDGTSQTVPVENGSYTATSEGPLESGEDITAAANDGDNNASDPVSETYTDTVPPEEATNVQVDTTAPDEVTVTGEAEPESEVVITFPDGTTVTTTTDADGNFEAVVTPAPNGSGDVEVTVTDKNGNGPVGPVTAPYTDVTPPDAPTIDELVDNPDGTVTVNGTAADPEAETVTVAFPDGTSQTVPVENGSYTATSEGPLESGEDITAAANDADNNASDPVSETYTDIENPEEPINVTVETTAPDEVTVTGEAEPESTVSITFPDGTTATAITDKEGNFEAVLTPAPNGSGDVEVTVTDKNGNGPVGPVMAPYTDVTPPDAPTIDELVDNPDGTVTVNGTAADPEAETVTVTFPDGTSQTVPVENGSYTATSNGPLETDQQVLAKTNDADGNSSDPVNRGYGDTTPPDEATNVAVDTTAPDEVTVTGEAEPESKVSITFPDGTTVTTITDADGKFEAVVTPAPNGSGDVEVMVTDKNGNGPVGPVTAPYTDVTPPDAPTIDELVDNPDGTVTVNGTATDPDAETVTVTFPDGTSQTVPVENGSYTATSEGPLDSGEDITAAANDADNNASDPVSETYIDTVLPEEPTNVAVDTTAPDEVTVTGEAEPESEVVITFPDGTTVTTTTDEEGNFEAVVTPAPNGSGDVEVMVTDKNGNGPVGPVTAPYADVTPPDAPTIDELVDNPDGTVTVNGTAADPEAETVTVTFPDGTSQTVPVENGSYTATSEGPLDSGEDITAAANDADNNASDPVSETYIDTVLPEEPTNVQVDTTAPDEVTVIGEAEPESEVVITFPDGTTVTTTTDEEGNFEAVVTPAPNGSGDVEVTVTDKNGNGPVGPVTAPYTDVTPPDAPTIDELVDNPDGTVTVNGTAADPEAETVTVTFPDGSSQTVPVENGSYTATSEGPLDSGEDISAAANDADNNASDPVSETYIDTVLPEEPTNVQVDTTGPDEVTVTGEAEPESEVVITFPDGTTVTTTTDADGNFEAVVTPAPNGSGDVEVTVTDKNGNGPVGPVTAPYTDVTPPDAPTIDELVDNPDGTVTVNGTAADPEAETVTVTFPDGTSQTVPVENGSYTATSEGPLDSGEDITAAANDADNNASDPVSETYTDTVLPEEPTNVQVDTTAPDEVTVTGEAEPESEVVITFPDGTTVTTTTDEDGNFEAVVTPAPNGSGDVEVTVTDKNGNGPVGPVTAPYIDVTPPDAPTIDELVDNPDGTVTVNGTAADPEAETVTVTFPDGTSQTVPVENGSYTATSEGPLDSGEDITAAANDADNNASDPVSETYTDTVPPEEATNVQVNTTAPDEVTVTGEAEPESEVTITFPDGTTVTTTTDEEGNFEAVVTPAPNGSGDVEVMVTDKNGNGPAGPVTAPYTDVTPPDAPTIDELVDNPNGTVTVNGTATDPEAETVTVTFPDGTSQTVPVENGSYTATSNGPLETDQQVIAKANDADGNSSDPVSRGYGDTTPPDEATNVAVENTAPDEVTVTGEAEPESKVSITFPDGTTVTTTTDADGTFEAVVTPAPNGSGDVEVMVTDKNGNGPVGPVTAPYTDVTPPDAPTIDELVDNPDGTVTVNGTATDPDAETVTVTFPDGTSQTVPVENGSYTATSEGPLDSGEDITAAANDADNNTSDPVSETYTDTVPPEEATNVVVENTAPDEVTVTGEAEPESEITITFPDGTTVTTTTDADGTFEAVVTPAPNGSGDVEVMVTDKNGNGPSGPVTAPYTDVTPPDAPTIDELVDNPDGTVTVNGTAADPDAETVTVTFPDGTSQTVPVENGSYTATSEGPLDSGEDITAAANDADNNTSDPVSETYVDTVPPEEAINVQVDTTAPDEVTVTGEAEPESEVTITFPDGTTVTTTTDADGNFEAVVTPAPNGSGDVEVMVTDKNGNGPSGPATAPYTDVTPPEVPTIDSVVTNDNRTVTVTGSVSDPDAETVTVFFPDGTSQTVPVEDGSYTATSTGPLQNDQVIEARANDKDGNSSEPASENYGITPPNAPTLSITGNADGTVTAEGQADPNTDIVVTFPDGSTATTTTDATGNYAVTSESRQPDGEVQAEAVNVVGSTPATPVQYELATPEISDMTKDSGTPGDYVTADGSAGRVITGTSELDLGPDVVVEVSVDGGATWHEAVVNGNEWTFIDNTEHSGDWTIQTRIHDRETGAYSEVTEQQVTLADSRQSPVIESVAGVDGPAFDESMAANGADVVTRLPADAVAGDVLHILWGNSTFDYVLTEADISAGTTTVHVPSEVTQHQGVDNGFMITAQIVTPDGAISDLSPGLYLPVQVKNPDPVADDFEYLQGSSINPTPSNPIIRVPGKFEGKNGTYTFFDLYGNEQEVVFTDPTVSGIVGTIDGFAGISLMTEGTQTVEFDLKEPATKVRFGLMGINTGVTVTLYDYDGNLIETFEITDNTYLVDGPDQPFDQETAGMVFPGMGGWAGYFEYETAPDRPLGKIVIDDNGDPGGVMIDNMETWTDLNADVNTGKYEFDHTIDNLGETYYGSIADDSVFIGESMDVAAYFAEDSAMISGGDGIDTLSLLGSGQVLDLRDLSGSNGQEAKISSIEVFDIDGSGSNTLKLSLDDVLNLGQTNLSQDGSDTVQLMIKGGSDDSVDLYSSDKFGGEWSANGTTTIDGSDFVRYEHSDLGVELLVQQGMTLNQY